MQTKRISVVIAAYNEEQRIARCVQAVSDQTFPRENYEILVIDNNSTDKTAEIAKKLGATVISYTEKQGAVSTKQFGVEKARGEIIAITDADSIPNKNWLENIDKLMQNKRLMCVGGTVLAATDGEVLKFSFVLYDLLAWLNQLFGISLVWGPNMAVRKSAFVELGGFNLDLKTSDDWEFILRVQKKFGIRSTLYTRKLQTKTSPRKHRSIATMIPYSLIGVINYLFIFIFRQSRTFGSLNNVR